MTFSPNYLLLWLLVFGLSGLAGGCAPKQPVPWVSPDTGGVYQPPSQQGGALEQSIRRYENLINVRLDGATDPAVAEVFGKVLNTVHGVIRAKRYSSRIIPDEPQACYIIWRATIDHTDPFRLQANILKMIDDVYQSGGSIYLKGVPYRYSPSEIDLLKGIRGNDATSREIQFVVDRELARDREMSGW
ncbi:MAG: hypothetical protein OEM02_15530 [Desulfobulbaceae bacterium]|nr:hypothetical protein [Desulfobulbaceae bacterium]